MSPASVVTVVRPMLRTRLARTTCSIVRRASISRGLTVAPRNASGSTEGSIRTNTPASSSRRAKSWPSFGRRRRLDPARLEPHDEPTRLSGCSEVAVVLPRIAAPDPADAIGVNSRLEQPHAGVDRRLPRPDHREAVRRLGEVDEIVGRDERDARFDRESGNVTRRDLGLDVGRVDDLAPRLYDGLGAVEQRRRRGGRPRYCRGTRSVPNELHPARRQQVLVEHA